MGLRHVCSIVDIDGGKIKNVWEWEMYYKQHKQQIYLTLYTMKSLVCFNLKNNVEIKSFAPNFVLKMFKAIFISNFDPINGYLRNIIIQKHSNYNAALVILIQSKVISR